MNRKSNAGKVRYWASLSLALLSPAYSYEMHWGYEGAEGPEHWGDIKPEFATCKTGTHQSPINIAGARKLELPPLKFDYRPASLDAVNNGHTIQVNVEPGSTFATGDRAYRLVQWHFHAPSEHQVKGRHHDLEVHFVHMDSERNIAVAAVFFDAGRENRALAPIWSRLPEKEGGR
ncbi:MAG: carbonic anhydrase [Burkholderiales bacterium]